MSHFVGLSSTNAPTAGAGPVTLTTVKRRQGHWQKIAKDLRLRAAADMAESSGYTDRAAVELDAIESEQAEVTSLLQVMSDKLKRCNDKYNSLQQGLTAQRPALTDRS